MFIDTHCHIDSYERHAEESFDALLARLRDPAAATSGQALPEAFIHVACDPADFERGKELSEKYGNVYAAYGIHPEYVDTETSEDEARLEQFLAHPKCRACGEFGLDYHYDPESRPRQIKLFERHLQIALRSGKPIVLHLREADDDALAVLKSADIRSKNIHVHCFTGSPEFAEALLTLDANIYIGFTGIITFKNAQNVRDAASLVPLDKILLETDAPYMAPIPYRGKPCHSGYIPYIADKLAEIKNTPVDVLYRQVRENTRRCYEI
jgi:TatD DNase family protein